MGMPNSNPYWGANLISAVNNGSVPESRVTDMAMRYVMKVYLGWS